MKKKCKKCNNIKNIHEFYSKGGNVCKDCANKIAMERYQEKKDEIKKQTSLYAKNNRDKINNRQRKYRDKNREKVNAYARNAYMNLSDSYVRILIKASKNKNQNIESKKIAILISRINKILEQNGQRKCDKCNLIKPLSEFPYSGYTPKGKSEKRILNNCTLCHNEDQRKRRIQRLNKNHKNEK